MMDQIAMTIGYFVLICVLGALVFGVLSFVAYLILLAWEAFSFARIEKPYCCAGKMDGDGNG